MNEMLPDSAPSHLDPAELTDWYESLDSVAARYDGRCVGELLRALQSHAGRLVPGVSPAFTTPYVNTIPPERQPAYPGDLLVEDRIGNLIRWNALAMVVRANHDFPGIGGHLASYASVATLFEVGFHHFFRAPSTGHCGDSVYFQGHSSPGIYSRAFLEGRLDALSVDRTNALHPSQPKRHSYLEKILKDQAGPFIAVTDYIRLVPDQIRQWVPGAYVTLGTDGFGRSDMRDALRRHFEVDAEHIVYAALHTLAQSDDFDVNKLSEVIQTLGIDPDSMDPAVA